MTTVKFLNDRNGLKGFEIVGHSTTDCDDTEGKLVCAAISSAALMAANTVTDIIGDRAQARAEDGNMSFKVENPCKASSAVLAGLKLHLNELSAQYPQKIRIITEV